MKIKTPFDEIRVMRLHDDRMRVEFWLKGMQMMWFHTLQAIDTGDSFTLKPIKGSVPGELTS